MTGHRSAARDGPGNGQDPSWRTRLAQARSARELLRLCDEYLLALSPAEIARLPTACRPVPLESPAELSSYALELVRHQYQSGADSPLLLRMAEFFANANVRMAYVLQHANDEADADRVLAQLGRPPHNDRDPEQHSP